MAFGTPIQHCTPFHIHLHLQKKRRNEIMERHKCKGSMSLWWENSKELWWNSRFMPNQREKCEFEPHCFINFSAIFTITSHESRGKHKLLVLCMLDFLDNSNMKGNLWNSTSDIHKFANNFFLLMSQYCYYVMLC